MSGARQARRKEKQKAQELTEAAGQARTSRWKPVIRLRRLALAAVAVVVGVLVVTGGSKVAGSSSQPSSARVQKEVSTLLSGISQSGETLGQPSAPVTLEIFGDLESADVRTFVVWLLPDIIRDWVRTNGVKIQYRSLMTASLSYPNVFASQQAAALAAGVQDRLWNFIETFYHEQGKEETRYVTEAYLDDIARQVPGLNLSEWESDREDSQLTKRVDEETHTARAAGLRYAPAFVIGRTGGKPTLWTGYRLYEEPGAKKGLVRRPVHPVAFITSRTLKTAVEHLP